MSAPFKNIAVVGAGGNLGPHILVALLRSHFSVTVIARNASITTFPSSVRVVKGDYSPAFLENALRGIDAVVMTVGASGIPEQRVVIDAAAKAGVRRILPSEFGSDATNPVAVKAVPFYQMKVDVVDYIKEVAIAHPTLTWSASITGPFYDWCLKLGVYGFDLANKKATLYDQGQSPFDTTTLSTVGTAVANLLSHPEKYVNEYVYISSFTTSQAEMLAALKKATGNNDWAVEHKSAQAYIDGGNEKLAKGDMMGTYDLIFGTTFQRGNGADFSSTRKLANGELGLERENVEQVTKEVYETDRHAVKW